ncbi:MAG: cofactor-independent phosphoglycerate mutase [Planctomycetaceae bacterium]|nr:cofactor-independent phosphoglycerate mutase [Planctomycetaceae bacterium]
MKYVLIIPDGAADEPIEQFGGKTVFEAADIPNIDNISKTGKLGLVQTVPEKMPPGSDVAMMSLLGYDPNRYYTGRAPLEAVAMNIQLEPTDWVFRCNLVTIADNKMADHSAGHISSPEGARIIEDMNKALGSDKIKFYPGVSYRHLCVIKGMDFDVYTEPPHDIIGQSAEKNLPRGKNAEILTELMAKSKEILAEHEINKIRKDLGENQVSSIWLWGQGKKASMDSFQSRFGLRGTTITAVDLVRGISKLIGFDLVKVEGATGFADTNYNGKAQAAIDALEKYDFVFIHIEGPDEAGHAGNAELKKLAVERIDKYVVAPVYNALQKYDSWRMLVMPDHPTPCKGQAHTGGPVPFAMAGTGVRPLLSKPFTENFAAQSGLKIEKGYELMEYFLKS